MIGIQFDAVGVLLPQEGEVVGKALVEPDVLPGGQRQVVAEPLVHQLVGNDELRGRVQPKEVERLVLHGIAQGAGHNHRAIGRKGIRTQQIGIELHHLRHCAERLGQPFSLVRREVVAQLHARPAPPVPPS